MFKTWRSQNDQVVWGTGFKLDHIMAVQVQITFSPLGTVVHSIGKFNSSAMPS